MTRALALAAQGQGHVEPNPMVGCVIARDEQIIAEGWHERFGGPHGEVNALAKATSDCAGATAYVTLEPCCHQGKTPPCTEALIATGVKRVVAAMLDPFPRVSGGGMKRLAEAGIETEVGLLAAEARNLCAPYLKLQIEQRPWIIAKWAMSLDGKLASRSGHSQWISNEASRRVVHELRGRVDAIMVGRHTAELDDPLLTARPPGARVATRIVVDSTAQLSLNSRLVKTAHEVPVLIATGPDAPMDHIKRLTRAGCEVLPLAAATRFERMLHLLNELGVRRMTNVLVEGGSQLLGTLFDAKQIDELHVFIAPKLIGGEQAPSPLGGAGLLRVPELSQLIDVETKTLEGDVYVRGRVRSVLT